MQRSVSAPPPSFPRATFAAAALLVGLTAAGCAPKAQPLPADQWKTRTVKDLQVDSPLALPSSTEISKQLNPTVKAMIASMDVFDSGDVPPTFRVMVLRTTYAPGVGVDLDGAVKGGLTQGAAAIGDHSSAPKDITPVKISGLEGRRAAYVGKKQGIPIHIDMVAAQEDQTIWVVQVIQVGDSYVKDAARVLESVKIGDPSKKGEAKKDDAKGEKAEKDAELKEEEPNK